MTRESILQAWFDDADPFAQFPAVPLDCVIGMIRLWEEYASGKSVVRGYDC